MRHRFHSRNSGFFLVVLALIASTTAIILLKHRGVDVPPAEASPRLDSWLGAQCAPGLDSEYNTSVVESDWEWGKRFYRPTLRVIAGRGLYARLVPLMVSPVTTIDRKRGCVTWILGARALLELDPDAFYVFGEIERISDDGVLPYLDAQVTEGPLKGAIVHMRHDSWTKGLGPYCCLYKVPHPVKISEGFLTFKVVMFLSGDVWGGKGFYRVDPYRPEKQGTQSKTKK
jgi:hypothetical protein